MPTTGLRDVSELIVPEAVGRATLIRTGPFVVLSVDEVRYNVGDGTFGLILRLPVGFRPPATLRGQLESAASGRGIAAYETGTVQCHRDTAYTIRYVFSFVTLNAWPSSLPGAAV